MFPKKKNLEKGAFSVVLPYYNEIDFLLNTLKSWLRQTKKPAQIILVDNGSTDGSEAFIKSIFKEVNDIDLVYLQEPKPGKTHALKKGCAAVNSEFVALADADTYYPPHYLEFSLILFNQSSPRTSVIMALDENGNPDAFFSIFRRKLLIMAHSIWKKHAFTGGYGQVFRTRSLEEAGGFSERIWDYVLLDHEIIYRIGKKGLTLYHIDLWCKPSTRRRDRNRVSWNTFEKAVYFSTPHRFQGWFFYRFLASRFKKRGLSQLNLREKTWQETARYQNQKSAV
jgi:glycosyltransferase involved in cell wall biosynthesis